jgi:TatD DNase family protein
MDRYEADLPAVIARAAAAGVKRLLVPGLDAATSQRAIQLASEHQPIYCAIGFHPTEAQTLGDTELLRLRQSSSAHKLVAIGEIGLDYYWVTDISHRRRQYAALQQQLALAQGANLPVVLHLREQGDAEYGDAAQDLLAILRDWTTGLSDHASSLRDRAGVLHSFSGSAETAAHAIELGFYIGVTGPITYPNAARRRTLVRDLPLDRILIETDSPFLAPQERRGKRNEPAYVVHIADRIADIRSRTPKEIAEATCVNAARLFGWGEPD